ncbi:MAG: DUF177 domain-containing protein [Paracoccaceae bacterium]
MTQHDPATPSSLSFLVSDLPKRREQKVLLTPDAEERKEIAEKLGVLAIKKLRFSGFLKAAGKTDWQFSAELGVTVVQSCVITLEPVTTRIQETTERRFVKTLPEMEANSEMEIPEDISVEALGTHIFPAQIMLEALILNLPQFPRSPGAALVSTNFTEPGKAAMTDADTRPFAGLKSLRDAAKRDTD